jgi:hypothetical protein
MVLAVSEPDGESPGQPDRLRELESDHLAAFTAFRRPQNDAEKDLVAEDLATNRLDPELNPALARRVYSGSEGTIYLVPGPGLICCVAIGRSGEIISGTTLTELVGRNPMGYVGGGLGPGVTFRGVLPAGGRGLRILQRAGRSVSVPLTEDESYWVTVEDPIAMCWTQADGTERRTEMFGPHRGSGGIKRNFG